MPKKGFFVVFFGEDLRQKTLRAGQTIDFYLPCPEKA
jgi:hypothetical protein